MARIKLILGVLTVVVASLVAFSGPAMADNLNCKDTWGNWIKCDGTYYAPVSHNYWNYPSYTNWWYPSYTNWWGSDWNDVQNCPFWGDTTGIVNQWDCFD